MTPARSYGRRRSEPATAVVHVLGKRRRWCSGVDHADVAIRDGVAGRTASTEPARAVIVTGQVVHSTRSVWCVLDVTRAMGGSQLAPDH